MSGLVLGDRRPGNSAGGEPDLQQTYTALLNFLLTLWPWELFQAKNYTFHAPSRIFLWMRNIIFQMLTKDI